LARRAEITLRPPTVFIRARNPCVRARRSFEGWNVRFMMGRPVWSGDKRKSLSLEHLAADSVNRVLPTASALRRCERSLSRHSNAFGTDAKARRDLAIACG
jgi:hypothetical protein